MGVKAEDIRQDAASSICGLCVRVHPPGISERDLPWIFFGCPLRRFEDDNSDDHYSWQLHVPCYTARVRRDLLSTEYGMLCFLFDLRCQLVRTRSGIWILTNLIPFSLIVILLPRSVPTSGRNARNAEDEAAIRNETRRRAVTA